VSQSTRHLRIALNALNREPLGTPRRREPVAIGVPLPRGVVHDAAQMRAVDASGQPVPMHGRALDAWPDGSVRWMLCELLVNATSTSEPLAFLTTDAPAATFTPVRVETTAGGLRLDTGRLQLELAPGLPFPFGRVTSAQQPVLDASGSGLTIDTDGTALRIDIAQVEVRSSSAVRAEVLVRGVARGGAGCPLEIESRLECFAESATIRVHTTLRNPRPAAHPGGCWVLGDPASVFVRAAECRLAMPGGVAAVEARVDAAAQHSGQPPFELYQESSGGPAWNSRTHLSRAGVVPLRYSGYRVRLGASEDTGRRAQPVVQVTGSGGTLAVAVPRFWQNFPQALTVDEHALTLAMFPSQAAEPQELQGGEQKTHSAVVAFAADAVSADPLAWVHDPLVVSTDPEWTAATGALPFVSPAARDPFADYLRLVAVALDDEQGFAAKQERADEYGWRNFGDLPADHESAFLPAGQVNVSHYNNQYDALAWFAVHFLRTGDPRWHRLMCDLAAHVRDIDIYHTTGDKAAYNGGLFWHTDHYLDAGTSTHRTYPTGSHGGGPSNEHNYNLGLLLHYLLTGDERSREAAVGLGQWAVDMDDGEQTVFRWLARGATGLASATGSTTYHGPGRGGANSILACMVAHRLTGDARFATKADELLRRCIHPADDLAARQLDDVERRWYYTVFLQALGYYLHAKWERQEFDAMFEYGRASLLHYCEYIVAKESPYLDHPERLEYPTETWVAQDLRKGDALLWAAFFARDLQARERYLAGAARFFDYAVPALQAMPTHVFTRPTVLSLALGWRRSWFALESLPAPLPSVASTNPWAEPTHFVPQKQVAFTRAKWLAAGTAALMAVALSFAVASLF